MLSSAAHPNLTIGLDMGDKSSRTCEVDAAGEVAKRATVATTLTGVRRYFGGREPCRVVLEVGTHSPWVSRLLTELGHEVIVSNPAAAYGRRRRNRNDDKDAEFLARQGRADPKLLHPIQHRSAQAQQDLAVVRSRDQLVRSRTKLICHARGAVKSLGGRIGRCSAETFAKRAMFEIPDELRPALKPILEMIELLNGKITVMDRQISRMLKRYPEAVRLQQPAGVGPVISIGYVLLIEDPRRFRKSRQVGPYFGMVPKQDESGESSPQLRITKSGDELGRRLMVTAAQYILGPHGPDCDLRRYGEGIVGRGGKHARKRAVVAVARRLAVMLHRLWVDEGTYDPDFVAKQRAA